MTSPRTAELRRETSESSIRLSVDLDGTGRSSISTTVPFFDHMLTALAKHSLIDLAVRATGDTHIDVHHTVEDIGIVLGKAGRKRWMGRRPHVRGTAMNPIDHPHGGGEGRTSGGRHPVTPWGKPTKGARTRHNKSTDKMIIRSRHSTKRKG